MNKRRPINHGTALILLSLFKGKKYNCFANIYPLYYNRCNVIV